MMHTKPYVLLILLFIFSNCNDDDDLKYETADNFIALTYKQKEIYFKEVHAVDIIGKDQKVIGKYFESKKSNLDGENELYRIHFYFYYKDSLKTALEFKAVEFVVYEPAKNGTGLDGTGYQYVLDGYKFEVSDLAMENTYLKGRFKGHLFYSPIEADTLTKGPVYIENGAFHVNLK